jgi:hypothetical protein
MDLFMLAKLCSQEERVLIARRENAAANAEADKKYATVVPINPTGIADEDGHPIDLTKTSALIGWLLNKYRGHEVKINDDGQIVSFFRVGLEDSLKRRGVLQRQMYANLEGLLENSVYSGYELGDKQHPRIERQNIYYAAAGIMDNIYGVRFKVDISNGERKGAYKDHKIARLEIKKPLSLYQGQAREGGVLQNESGSFVPIREIKKALEYVNKIPCPRKKVNT